MDKNQKSTGGLHKTGTTSQSDKMKDHAKQDTSSKKMMDQKSVGKSEKAMHTSSDKNGKLK